MSHGRKKWEEIEDKLWEEAWNCTQDVTEF
jgi:hypothetical protein